MAFIRSTMDRTAEKISFEKGWTEGIPNPHTAYPRIYSASSVHTTYNRNFSDYHLFDSDYFRFKTLSLGYTSYHLQ
ncbi:hypothetical protein NXW24_20830 [Bacteroides fragilis]|nr:hypothetical protein [Bacteroides fragilis]